MKINEKRLLNTFLQLVRIDSESYHEKEIQQWVVAELKKCGCEVYVDKAGKKVGSNAPGNIIATLKGTRPGKPFLLAAHLDTVIPGNGVKPVLKNGRVYSDGKTVLGADDKSGVAIMLELARVLQQTPEAHNGVQFIFTLNEENGMTGAKHLDYAKIKGTEGLVLDNEDLDELLVRAPQVHDFRVTIEGVSAHAGVCPEKGISALEVAAYALSRMKLGRIDADTVCNFGIVQGGRVTNAVMPLLTLEGEVRGLKPRSLQKQLKHMKDCFAAAAKAFTKRVDGKILRPRITLETPLRYGALNVPEKARVVQLACAAAKKYGITLRVCGSGGGFDGSVMAEHGLLLPDLGLGVQKCHTPQEYLIVKDFYTAARIVLDVVLAYK